MVRRILAGFYKDARGQDISEYCLLTALIALVALGIFIHLSGGVQAIWCTASSTIAANSGTTGNPTQH